MDIDTLLRIDYHFHMKCKKCGNKTKISSNKFCSRGCYYKTLKEKRGEKNINWRPVIGMSGVHYWLAANYGKPKKCEGNDCRKKSSVYDWALKTGKTYEKERNNFLRLCRSCHRRYDFTESKKEQAIKNLWWQRGGVCPGIPHPENLWWFKDEQKMKEYKKRNL